MYVEIIKIVTSRVQKNRMFILIFMFLGFVLASMGFEMDDKSYSSMCITAMTTVASLIGFLGIFVIYKLQNLHDIKNYHVNNINKLKNELKIYKGNILIVQYQSDIINKQLAEIRRTIKTLNEKIEFLRNVSDPTSYGSITDLMSDDQKLKEIQYNLELIMNLNKNFNLHVDSFLFAIFSIFLFMIPLVFNNIHFFDNSYIIFFDNWRFLKMPFVGLLLALFFLVLKDLANMLTEFFSEYS